MISRTCTDVGYGVLADADVSPNTKRNSEFSSSTGISNTDHRGFYGSINTISIEESYSNWYSSDYDLSASMHINDSNVEDVERVENRSTYSDEGSYCSETEKEGAVVLSNDVFRDNAGDTSGGEQTYYSPFYKNKTVGVASTLLVGWNIINLLLSTSILAFPFAVATGGIIVLPFVLVVGFMTVYTSRILISMMYEPSTIFQGKRIRIRVDYADLGQDVFNSSRGSWFVQSLQVLEMLMICVLNICVLGSLCHEILPKVDIKICTVIVACMALPTFFIRKLVVIGWMQTIGVFSLAIGLLLIQVFAIINIKKWKISELPKYNTEKLPIAIGILIYAFGIQGVMPGLEEQMRKPKRFGFVVNITFLISSIVQIVFSFSNAALYRTRTNQVITIDLEDHLSLGIATACFLGISILSHFSLPTFVVLEKLDTTVHNLFPCCSLQENHSLKTFLSVILRIMIIAISVGISVLIPFFAYLMALVGSGVTVMSALIVPCWFHLKLRRHYLPWYVVVLDWTIILFGLLAFGFGTYFSYCSIYNEYMGFM